MALTEREFKKLRTKCCKLNDGPDYRIHDYVKNILNTVLDFQMKEPTVSAAMDYYEENLGYRTHKKLQEVVDGFPNTKRGNLRLANLLWGNNHWTRAQFLRVLLSEFASRGIKGQRSLKKWIEQADFKQDIKGQFVAGRHSIGLALFHWLRLRLGIETVKPDVHIVKFVSNAVGRKVSQQVALESLLEVAKQTKRKASRLDAAIWHYQRGDL